MKSGIAIVGVVIAWCIGYLFMVVPLNLLLPTDYPHQPGDGYWNLVKAIPAALFGWYCARDWYRRYSRKDGPRQDAPSDR